MKGVKNSSRISSSFRDPSGFVFERDGLLYRQINAIYKEDYDHLMTCGLYRALVDAGLLIPHEEVNVEAADNDKAYKIIRPEPVGFISYPYEWSFSQLKDAALTTLKIQEVALDYGMSLKDCSAYNIQFRGGRPVLIDTLSFEKYCEGRPWVAYKQFCQHFLAPLSLMSHRDIRLSQLLRLYIDGIPLDLASALLPFRTWFSFSMLAHIHLHAKSQKHYAGKAVDTRRYKVSRLSLRGLIDNLASLIREFKWSPEATEWANYYSDTNYSEQALRHKKQVVARFLDRLRPKNVWDLGSNVGLFSRIASDKGIPTVSLDNDPAAVELNYLECRKKGETNLLPLLIDLTNPSPGIGWGGNERMSLLQRGPADTVLALALVHHLAISNNVPLGEIAEFLSRLCNSLVIEFVPKTDSQVKRLLATREDVFRDYSQQVFELEFSKLFVIEDAIRVVDSQRTIYLMTRRSSKS